MINDEQQSLLTDLKAYTILEGAVSSKGFFIVCNALYYKYRMSPQQLIEINPFSIIFLSEYAYIPLDLIPQIIESDPRLIKFIKNPSFEHCVLAIKKNLTLLKYVPKTPEIIEWIFSTLGNSFEVDALVEKLGNLSVPQRRPLTLLQYFNEIDQTEDVILRFVKANFANYGCVKKRTPDLNKKAFDIDYNTIQYIPEATEDMTKIALIKDINIFKKLPESLKSVEICIYVLEKNPELFSYVSIVDSPDSVTSLNNLKKHKSLMNLL